MATAITINIFTTGKWAPPLNIRFPIEYDRLGRRKKMTSADIGTKEWWYDVAGNVITRPTAS